VKHKYHDYQKELIICKGIDDLHPYKITLPDAPPPEKVTNYGKAPKDQYFQREVLPRELVKIDSMVKANRISYDEGLAMIEADPVLSAYCETLIRKFTGEELVFQYINGHLLHIPSEYWAYLNFWEIPKVAHNRPEFRVDFYHYCTDLWLFTFWHYWVLPNMFCMGTILFTSRQVGKSYQGGLLGFMRMATDYEAHAGMQSKTTKDAANTFNTRIVRPWRNMLFIFKPKYSNSDFPKGESGIQCTPHADRAKKLGGEELKEEDDYIMGSFTYGSSATDAYDGPTLDYYFGDEFGKTVEANVSDRWATVKEALKRRGGKAYIPTTVEEMEKKGGENFFQIWDDSDRSPIKRGAKELTVDINGETNSGLHPWFMPAYCLEVFDEYGISIVENITERQIAYLKSVSAAKQIKYPDKAGKESVDYQINREKNQQKRQTIIRKKPRSIREARASGTTFCHYNLAILDERIKYFTHGYTNAEVPVSEYALSEIENEVVGQTAQSKADWVYAPGVRWGKFEWIDPLKPYKCGVYFQPTSFDDAKFHINHLLDPGMRNKWVVTQNGKWKPANAAKFRSGADPFKYNTPDVKNKYAMSHGAQHIYMFQDSKLDYGKPREKWVSQNLIYEYFYRGDSMLKAELFEDYAKACIYFGCKLYPERNIDEVLDHFKRNGLEHYIHLGIRVATKGEQIGYKQETVGGDITNTLVIQNMHRHNADFVNNDARGCIFYRTLRQLRIIENDFNPFDLAASVAYTLMASFEADIANKAAEMPASLTKADIEAFTEWSLS